MKKRMFLFLMVIPFIAGCSVNPEIRTVDAAFKAFSRDVLSGNSSGIDRRMPFLAARPAEEREDVLAGLVLVLAEKNAYTISIPEDGQAFVQLKDGRRTLIPFTKTAAGVWIVAERLVRTRTIDFIQAE